MNDVDNLKEAMRAHQRMDRNDPRYQPLRELFATATFPRAAEVMERVNDILATQDDPPLDAVATKGLTETELGGTGEPQVESAESDADADGTLTGRKRKRGRDRQEKSGLDRAE